MQRSAFIAAGLLIVVGAIFLAQGLGILRGSSFRAMPAGPSSAPR